MKNAVLVFLFAACGFGQTILSLNGPPLIAPGNSVAISLVMSGSAGLSVDGLEWGLIPPAGVTLGAPVLGPASVGATKFTYCFGYICLLFGMDPVASVISNLPMSDGIIATYVLSVGPSQTAGPIPLPLSSLFAASTSGASLPVTNSPAYSITVTSKCDLNTDGTVDVQDVQIMVNIIRSLIPCPGTLTCSFQTLIQIAVAAGGGVCTIP